MKKLSLIFAFALCNLIASAQMSKSEVETMMNGVNLKETPDIFLIRTRQHDGTSQGWFEKYEKLDTKTTKITYNERSLLLEGTSYTALIPYDKIKLIFVKKSSFLSIEMMD
ncbi:MAG: hypothetical protein Q8M29_18595 [Bacteroidota bacterium]|nr:hypothetical protein [Bacteroidota bacterium]